jgi:hypothetical protein
LLRLKALAMRRLSELEPDPSPSGTGITDGPLAGAELPWGVWARRHFPHVTSKPFAARHLRLWEWFESLTPGQIPRHRVEIWPRGGAKSSSAELACCRLGVRLARRFVLYVSGTQEQANKHVGAITDAFETLGVGRAVNRYGASRGWRMDLLRTENGFNVAAFGLDAGARGVKLGAFRPDVLILDDIDERHDTPGTTAKKIEIITDTLLPAGSDDAAVLFLQNKIHRDSIAAQLADGRADFLHNREPAYEEPAVRGLQVETEPRPDGTLHYRITAGEPTWAGQDLATCEAQINLWGLRAFRREAQHEVDAEEGGLWSRELLRETRLTRLPAAPSRIVVAIDPNASEGGDEAGIVVAGKYRVGETEHAVVLEDATVSGGPKTWAEAAVSAYHRHHADALVAEKNNGGEMVKITIGTVPDAPPVKLLTASRGKLTRAEPVQKLYADGRAHHLGHFPALETELCTYQAGMPSPNRLDAAVWALTELMLDSYNVGVGYY